MYVPMGADLIRVISALLAFVAVLRAHRPLYSGEQNSCLWQWGSRSAIPGTEGHHWSRADLELKQRGRKQYIE